ncbi:MAG: hypothetical protein HY258_00290 [Chloroflexi bacterium]|nr:hypothetical protein [Chloroflexota bacterium]
MATHKEDNLMAETKIRPDTLRGRPSLSLIGLLIVQIIIGYEWLNSGIAKFVAGDFASGLADELAAKTAEATGWYASFLNSLVIPNGIAFGYLIETAEVLAGIALIVGPLLWIFAWDRVSDRMRSTVLVLMIAAALGGVFMALNFHVANVGNHPWVLPDSGFDEGVDVDLLLSGIQIVIAAVQIFALNGLRRERTVVVAATSQVKRSV